MTQLVFGPYTPFPVEFRVMASDAGELVRLSDEALSVMRGVPDVREANRDWGSRSPTLRFVLDQDRLKLIGLSPTEAAQQLQFLLSGITVTQVRENIRIVDIVARSAGEGRPPHQLSVCCARKRPICFRPIHIRHIYLRIGL